MQEATGIAAENTAQKTEEGKAAAEVKKVRPRCQVHLTRHEAHVVGLCNSCRSAKAL